jgi:hypothetical protein
MTGSCFFASAFSFSAGVDDVDAVDAVFLPQPLRISNAESTKGRKYFLINNIDFSFILDLKVEKVFG